MMGVEFLETVEGEEEDQGLGMRNAFFPARPYATRASLPVTSPLWTGFPGSKLGVLAMPLWDEIE